MAKNSTEADAAYAEALKRIKVCGNERQRRLDLKGLGLTMLPSEIGELAQLTTLCLEDNRLTSVPAEIGQLTQLTELGLHNNLLTSVRPEIYQLTQLTWLAFSNNKLASVPPGIGQLVQLKALGLDNNRLTALPPDIEQLSQLVELNLSNNRLTAMPPEIRQLKALKRLLLDGNPLVTRPSEFGKLADQMSLSNNKRPLRVFLSYSHDDKTRITIFRNNLIALKNDGYITFWDDPNIKPDMDWRPEIDRELEAMDVFVGLLTTNFVASKFIQRVEFKRAMERRKEKTAQMWLVLVDDRRIEGTKYEGIQVLKPGGKAVSLHKSLRAGFDVAEKELHHLVIELWKAQENLTDGRQDQVQPEGE